MVVVVYGLDPAGVVGHRCEGLRNDLDAPSTPRNDSIRAVRLFIRQSQRCKSNAKRPGASENW